MMKFFRNPFRRKEDPHPYSQSKPSRQPWLFGIRRKDPTRAEFQLCSGRARLMDENHNRITRSISLNFESGEFTRDMELLIVEAKMVICLDQSGAWDRQYFQSHVCRYLSRDKVQVCVDKCLGYLDPHSPETYDAICEAWKSVGIFKIYARWA